MLLEVRDGESVLDRAVEVAHRHLGLDAVYIAELTDDLQIYRAVAGDCDAFGLAVAGCHARPETFCHRLVAGEIPPLIRDAQTDTRVCTLPGSRTSQVGAYVGVPLRYGDGGLYGTICALARTPDATLDDRDVRFLQMIAELLASHLDEARAAATVRRRVDGLLTSQQLDVAAQPIVRLADGACLGIEALARFSPDMGSPAAAFAAAERVGRGFELERLAVSRAWPLLDLLAADQFLTVNVSPATTAALSARARERTDISLEQVVIEITEHAVIDGYADLRALLAPLRAAGLRVAVDDAGAGYASLRHVVELRPDFIKVDRDLVHGLADDHARRVAVSAFVLLALDLDATVIAEGLERPRDLAALCDLGVDAAQGYLLGRPTLDRADVRAALAGANDRRVMPPGLAG